MTSPWRAIYGGGAYFTYDFTLTSGYSFNPDGTFDYFSVPSGSLAGTSDIFIYRGNYKATDNEIYFSNIESQSIAFGETPANDWKPAVTYGGYAVETFVKYSFGTDNSGAVLAYITRYDINDGEMLGSTIGYYQVNE